MRDDWGFGAIRWVMPWAAVEPEAGQYDEDRSVAGRLVRGGVAARRRAVGDHPAVLAST